MITIQPEQTIGFILEYFDRHPEEKFVFYYCDDNSKNGRPHYTIITRNPNISQGLVIDFSNFTGVDLGIRCENRLYQASWHAIDAFDRDRQYTILKSRT